MILLRMLHEHPEIKHIIPVSSSRMGESVLTVDPGIHPSILEKTTLTDGNMVTAQEAADLEPEVVFAALPHLASATVCEPFFGKSVVIDLSADFRIKDTGLFEKAYGQAPPRPDLLEKAVYGLCEWYQEDIKKAQLIANPGCYPTATLLPLIPLWKKGLISGKVIVNALSGISGAGRKAKMNLIFVERSENTCAYNPGKQHRHTTEIQKELDYVNKGLDVFFTPHLVPLKRGMAVTTTVELTKDLSNEEIAAIYEEAYKDAPFVNLKQGRIPETGDVRGSNRCDISFHKEGNTLLLFSVIDNLVKGASGQAVQNMNIRFGFKETAGIKTHGEI